MSTVDTQLENLFSNERRMRIMDAYRAVRERYQELAREIAELLERALRARNIKFVTIQQRVKTVESFGDKALKPSSQDTSAAKYTQPLDEIEDLAGIRVITLFLDDIERVEQVIGELFQIWRRENKGEVIVQEDRFGYQSVHYIVSMPDDRLKLMELPQLHGLKAEIQVRTVLQHAWAEIEHDIQYKTSNPANLSHSVRRRFAALAGMLEIADREFQSIQYDDSRTHEETTLSTETPHMVELDLTPGSLKEYLDSILNPDARLVPTSYEPTTAIVRSLGFKDISEIDSCIGPYLSMYRDRDLSSIAWRAKQGQIKRFETLLLAAMGEEFIARHPKQDEPMFIQSHQKALSRLVDAGIQVGTWTLEKRAVI